jgi:PTH1 family peptidyl-tRNA hydrolase
MRLWVGLGNPEPRMRLNRHNIGFMALEAIAARHPFSGWRNRFAGRLAEGTLSGVHILLHRSRSLRCVQSCGLLLKLVATL